MASRTGIIIIVAQMEAVTEKKVNLIQQRIITSSVKRKMDTVFANTHDASTYLRAYIIPLSIT